MSELTLYISTATALMFIIEGLLYFLFPDQMKSLLELALKTPNSHLRLAALIAMSFGVICFWFLQMRI